MIVAWHSGETLVVELNIDALPANLPVTAPLPPWMTRWRRRMCWCRWWITMRSKRFPVMPYVSSMLLIPKACGVESILNGVLESLVGKRILCASSAIVRLCATMPLRCRKQTSAPGSAYRLRSSADRADLLDGPPAARFRLVEGEVDLSVTVWLSTPHRARKLQRSRISPRCARWRRWPAQSRFRAPGMRPMTAAALCPVDRECAQRNV